MRFISLLTFFFIGMLGIAHSTDLITLEDTQKAAEQGDATAQYNLGAMYANGQGITQNDQEAVKWYQKAAEQGHVDSQAALGAAYYLGRGVAQDNQAAMKWLQKAAEQGHAQAQNALQQLNFIQ